MFTFSTCAQIKPLFIKNVESKPGIAIDFKKEIRSLSILFFPMGRKFGVNRQFSEILCAREGPFARTLPCLFPCLARCHNSFISAQEKYYSTTNVHAAIWFFGAGHRNCRLSPWWKQNGGGYTSKYRGKYSSRILESPF